MTGTILEYIRDHGPVSFFEEPVNEVDSLVLCQFAYLKFDGMVPDVKENKASVTLQELRAHKDYEKLFKNTWFEKHNQRLFEGMLASRRFRNIKMNCYTNIIEAGWETQFSAITFLLEDGSIYIVYRGTDENIVGWKEDLNMAFLDPIPGQEYSVKYLNMVVGKLHQPFYIGGHSKGGNLAVYAAMNCPKEVQERIIKVYNMDGPSFRPQVLEKYDYKAIEEKTVKILPHSSLVGMIFEQGMNYRVVKSKAVGLLQHDPFSWNVKYGRFVDTGQVFEGQRFVNDTLNEWILSLNEEQLRVFVNTLYQVISAAEKDNLIDFSIDWQNSINSMVTAVKEVDDETKNMIKETFKALFQVTQLRVKEEITNKPKELLETITQKIESIEIKENLLGKFGQGSDVQDATALPEQADFHE